MSAILISFRETLEASLLFGVVLAFLFREEEYRAIRIAIVGAVSGIFASIASAFILGNITLPMTEESSEPLEGIFMIAVACTLLWITTRFHGNRHAKAVEDHVRSHQKNGALIGIFFLCFLVTVREGLEMVLFLRASDTAVGGHSLLGILLGAVLGIGFATVTFLGLTRIPLRICFRLTSILLLLLGFGLTIHGLGIMGEALPAGILSTPLWDSTNILQRESLLGHIASSMIGYEEKPTLLQMGGGLIYIVLALTNIVRAEKRSVTS